MKSTLSQEDYWTQRYLAGITGWDIGAPSRPLKEYFDQLTNTDLRILIPGAGKAHEAEYLHRQGFKNVFVLDISSAPLEALSKRVEDFPNKHLIKGDFFSHNGSYDLIVEQTFFCSFEPSEEKRASYFQKCASLLRKEGRLIGLWFKHKIIPGVSKRPFGGSQKEYEGYLEDYFHINTFEDCYNSIPPRMGNELFGIFVKK